MGRLSLKKKITPTGGNNQAKITGFFNKPSSSSSSATEAESSCVNSRNALENVTNLEKFNEKNTVNGDQEIFTNNDKIKDTMTAEDVPRNYLTKSEQSLSSTLVTSPIVSRRGRNEEEMETFTKTPENVPKKRKFKLKSRASGAKLGFSECESKTGEVIKRGFDSIEEITDSRSPVFKRQKTEVVQLDLKRVDYDVKDNIEKEFKNVNLLVKENHATSLSSTAFTAVTSTQCPGSNPSSWNNVSPIKSELKYPLKEEVQNPSNKISPIKRPQEFSTCNQEDMGDLFTNLSPFKCEVKSPLENKDDVATKLSLPIDGKNAPVTPSKQADMDFMFACLEDSPFKCDEEEVVEKEQPLASKFGRYKVTDVRMEGGRSLVLDLEHCYPPVSVKQVVLQNSWANTAINQGDILHLDLESVGVDDQGRDVVNDKVGLVVVNPDSLVSGTSVVSALFCMRKAVLAEKYKGVGGGGGNRIMLVGTVVHELLQIVLKEKSYKRHEILQLMDRILKGPRIMSDMLTIGLTDVDMRKEIEPFIGHIQYFVRKFLMGHQVARPELEQDDKKKKGNEKPQWGGLISGVMDIEENFWSPRLGVKGKIDLTVETEVRGVRQIQPLEIKTGKPSYSSSHCGQVILYCMMSGDRRRQSASGLLLYLRSSSVADIPAGRNEQRGLIQLRNELVSWLKYSEFQSLPDPVSHQTACANCEFLPVCGLHQLGQNSVPAQPHPMSSLVPDTLSYLTPEHVIWFHKWSGLLEHEERTVKSGQSVKDLWCMTPEQREERGQAMAGLELKSYSETEGHIFVRPGASIGSCICEGEVVVVSTDKELALVMGVVTKRNKNILVINLDRDLTGFGPKFVIDKYVYQGGQTGNYVGLARIMSDSEQANRLRQVVIEGVVPNFTGGLPREVATHGREVLKHLNRVQQKAVFRCLMSDRFSLIRGMPGAGKTTTVVGLVRLLVRLGQSVLVVAYTNSAVDTILVKLVEQDERVLRLGRKSRVRPELVSYTADEVVKDCSTPDEMRAVYNGHSIVGGTCLAVDHPATVDRKFDWCLVDEASQAVLPSVISPLLLAARFVLVGDPAQLAPTVQSRDAREGGLDQSLFTLLDQPSVTLDLHLQYRMNSRISQLANHLTYEGKLECGDQKTADRVLSVSENKTDEEWVSACLSSCLDRSVIWLDTGNGARETQETAGFINRGEMAVVNSLVQVLIERGVAACEIGVIAPYSAQVTQLKEMMSALIGVEVGTVDQYQGRDKEVIIYSCTRSNLGGDGVRAGNILLDTRRLNVAVTRAKVKLIILGDRQTLVRDYQPFNKIDNFFKQEDRVKLTTVDFNKLDYIA